MKKVRHAGANGGEVEPKARTKRDHNARDPKATTREG
jgi:hypothetical protein